MFVMRSGVDLVFGATVETFWAARRSNLCFIHNARHPFCTKQKWSDFYENRIQLALSVTGPPGTFSMSLWAGSPLLCRLVWIMPWAASQTADFSRPRCVHLQQMTCLKATYRVAQLKWGQLTSLMVTFECIVKKQVVIYKNIIINSKANKYQQNYKQTILP